MVKGWITISIREEIRQKLESIYLRDPKKPRNQRFNAWLDNLLFGIVEYDEKLQEYGAFLQVESIGDAHVLLMDNLTGKHVVIQISRKGSGKPGQALYCEQHLSTDCLHVGFCQALPEVFKVLISKGFTPSSEGREGHSKYLEELLKKDADERLKANEKLK
jgi:hypothetical protein